MSSRNIPESIFNFVYNEALDDAVRRTRAAGIKNSIINSTGIKKAIKKYADQIIAYSGGKVGIEERDEKFITCIKEIMEALPNETKEIFTFGNAVKLITMTMKYLYIRYCGTSIETNFDRCYAPMDSLMIETVFRDCNGDVDFSPKCTWSLMTTDKNETDEKRVADNFWNYQKAIDKLVDNEAKYRNRLDYEYKRYNEIKNPNN